MKRQGPRGTDVDRFMLTVLGFVLVLLGLYALATLYVGGPRY